VTREGNVYLDVWGRYWQDKRYRAIAEALLDADELQLTEVEYMLNLAGIAKPGDVGSEQPTTAHTIAGPSTGPVGEAGQETTT
jgi:hypothetical protein